MRYLPLSSDDRADMLARIGVEGIDDLFCDAPQDALLKSPLELPHHRPAVAVDLALFDGTQTFAHRAEPGWARLDQRQMRHWAGT